MNYKEFKACIEAQGITDETEISYIDTDMYKPVVIDTGVDVHIE